MVGYRAVSALVLLVKADYVKIIFDPAVRSKPWTVHCKEMQRKFLTPFMTKE